MKAINDHAIRGQLEVIPTKVKTMTTWGSLKTGDVVEFNFNIEKLKVAALFNLIAKAAKFNINLNPPAFVDMGLINSGIKIRSSQYSIIAYMRKS